MSAVRPVRRGRAVAVAVALAIVAVGGTACTGEGDDAGQELGQVVPTATSAATGAGGAYDRDLCDLIYSWRGELAEGVERLSREGVPQPSPGRHDLAVDVVDELVAATEAFAADVAALGTPPDPEVAEVVEREVTAGADAAVGQLQDARDHFATLGDDDFEDLVYRGAELASYLEKASSLVTQRLELLASEHGVSGPNEICGFGRLVD